MSWFRRRLLRYLAATLIIGCTGCGFHPLFGQSSFVGNAATVQLLSEIVIEPVETETSRDRSGLLLQNTDRIGQLLRNAMYERMTPKGHPAHPRYVLEVHLSSRTDNLGIRKDATATRANMTISVTYHLKPYGAPLETRLVTETLRAVASYNLLDAQYATVVSQRDAEIRTTRQLADDITNRLATYFATSTTAKVASEKAKMRGD